MAGRKLYHTAIAPSRVQTGPSRPNAVIAPASGVLKEPIFSAAVRESAKLLNVAYKLLNAPNDGVPILPVQFRQELTGTGKISRAIGTVEGLKLGVRPASWLLGFVHTQDSLELAFCHPSNFHARVKTVRVQSCLDSRL